MGRSRFLQLTRGEAPYETMGENSLASAIYNVVDQERMTRAKRYFAWQSRLASAEIGQRIVEVGCGVGNFTELLLARECVVAVDAEPACLDRLRARFGPRPNLHPVLCDAASPSFRALARFQPDSCVCLNVLEHIEDDRGALMAMASILAPGGVIVLLAPAFPTLFGPIDHNLGHHRRYTRAGLRRLADEAGLSVQKLHFLNSVGFFGWWINARILQKEAQSEAQIEIFDRLVVPVLSRLEAIAPPPFGQSLFAVLRKR